MSDLQRLDQLLLAQGLARSRAQGQKLITAGLVSVCIAGRWQVVTKVSAKFANDTACTVAQGEENQYVSRAGLKLAGALQRSGLNVSGLHALDVGQSTGGFTDCLLQHGVAHVVGVDVGHGQLDTRLQNHPQVTSLEKCNARELSAELLMASAGISQFSLVVMDVSFISQSLIWPRLAPLLAPGGHVVSLVKPQFEVGVEGVGKGGLVKDASLYLSLEQRLRKEVASLGLHVVDFFDSPIRGGDGNREFFLIAGSD